MARQPEPRIFASVLPLDWKPARVVREFRAALDAGARIECVGSARRAPLRRLLGAGYAPQHRIDFLDASYWISAPRENADLRFFVAYVETDRRARRRRLHARLFYKDVSLIWRCASHFIRSESENWIGKGDLKVVVEDGIELEVSNELTTDLPLEIQTALESVILSTRRFPRDDRAVERVLQRGGDARMAPFAEFTAPRRRAERDPRLLVHAGRPIARFARANRPESLVFARGYAPDFDEGVAEVAESRSRLYGGRVLRFRIASCNRKVQYAFFAGPRQVWIASCQPTHGDLSSFGVRTTAVDVPDDLLLPGYEYHFIDDSEDPPRQHSQIPPGFAGAASEVDPSRADASAWLERMPVVRDFRRRVLARRLRGPRALAARSSAGPEADQ